MSDKIDEASTKYIKLHSADNVGVALSTLAPNGGDVQERIERGHKIALQEIPAGGMATKYGNTIGRASVDIPKGTHIHTHNLAFEYHEAEAGIGLDYRPKKIIEPAQQKNFMGYHRANGDVGTRNYIAVLSSVNCSATVAQLIARDFPQDELAHFENIDGIAPFIHGTGCGLDIDGMGFQILQRVLWGYARNPNIGGVLMVGLGCEVNQISFLLDAYQITAGPLFKVINIQSAGGTRQSINKGIRALQDMLPEVNKVARKAAPISKLKLGLQCGGSDGWSGITANPALGAASDLLVQNGGTAVLSETPEIYGAEHLLIARANTIETAQKLTERVNWWCDYTQRHGGSMDNNPSPGNKRGGLTTILEKSLGAVSKSGTSGLMGVYQYGEKLDQPGLVFMDTPGYDPVSVTGQIAGGCNMICFTTGRGSAFGSKPAPTIKLASNSALFESMREDMDINCGVIIDDGVSIAEMGTKIFSSIIETASGAKTCSENLGLGDLEFVPWQIGTTM